jgi:hypothetical protein
MGKHFDLIWEMAQDIIGSNNKEEMKERAHVIIEALDNLKEEISDWENSIDDLIIHLKEWKRELSGIW